MMTKTLIEIAKEQGAFINETDSITGGDCTIIFNSRSQLKATIDAYNAQMSEPAKNTYIQTVPNHCDRIVWRNRYYHLDNLAPQPNQDLISREDAIQAIINVGGKRVWEFADAIRYLGK